MITAPQAPVLQRWVDRVIHVRASSLAMTLLLLIVGFLLLYPATLIIIYSFNTQPIMFVGPFTWGLENWRVAFHNPVLLRSLGNTMMIWCFSVGISLPLATAIAWALARTRVPFSHTLEFLFWLSFMVPAISNTVAWITMLDKNVGILNKVVQMLPFVHQGPFNEYSIPAIIWVHLMTNGIGIMVMLLTPAFRNMDASLEEAARVGGASTFRTAVRVTLPLMISPIILVFALQLVRVFQSFEIEQLLGTPFHFFVYSTLIYQLTNQSDPPSYGQATALASLTLLVVALIIPIQRWVINRRRYTTITGHFRPGLINLGMWQPVVNGGIILVLLVLVAIPVLSLILTTLMTRAGFFGIHPVFTLAHWKEVFSDERFISAFKTTFVIAFITALISPVLFSIFAYIIVRTKWVGRSILDSVIWISAAIPGILTGLGLLMMFLGTPGLAFLYGSIYALMVAVIFQGHTTGTNIMKGVFLQIGQEMEEAARISGAGWVKTYFKIWLPLLMPTMILIGTLHFTIAAGTTGNIVLLASRTTTTLSLLALEYASPGVGLWEEASAVGLTIIVMTVGVALIARSFGLRLGIHHQ